MSDVKKEYGFEDEINWAEKLSDPAQWYPLYYIVLLVGIVYGGVYYLNNMNDMKKQEIANSYYFDETISESDQLNIDSEPLILGSTDEAVAMSDKLAANLSAAIMTLKNSDSQAAKNLMKVTNDPSNAMVLLYNNRAWMSGLNDFKNIVTANIPENGFNSSFSQLSDNQLLELHGLLTNQINGL